MVQPTKNWNTYDGVLGLWLVYSSYIRRIRNTVNTLMGTSTIEVVDVLAHQSSQMALTENDDMIQALAPDTTDEALARRIRFRRTHGGLEDLNVAGNKRETWTKLIVIVTDQKPRTLLKQSGIAPLLNNPGIAWRPSDTEVDHPPRFQLNDEEDKDRAEE